MNKNVIIVLVILGLLLGTILVVTLTTPSVSAAPMGGSDEKIENCGMDSFSPPSGETYFWDCKVFN